ncbi:MAG: hypothetical protein H0W88_00490 [Parachlamydiaceae bacterium]|nr:hypothetical protein [Parachlamydiaceae bacterium]
MNASILPDNKPPTPITLHKDRSEPSAETTKISTTSQIGLAKISNLITPKTSEIQTTRKVKLIKKELKLESAIAELKEKILNLKQEVIKLKKEQEPSVDKRLKELATLTIEHTDTKPKNSDALKTIIQLKEDEIAKAETELAKTSAKLINLQKNLGFDEAEWIRFALNLLKHKPKIKIEKKYRDILLKKIVNIGLKSTPQKELTIHEVYQGTFAYDHSITKVEALRDLIKKSLVSGQPAFGMKTGEERRGLQRLLQNRLNLLEIHNHFFKAKTLPKDSDEYSMKVSEINALIKFEINNLENNINSNRIMVLEDGSKFFGFPGGWPGHHISYGIKKNVDGSYEFLMFNRGEQSSNPQLNRQFHGSTTFEDKNKTFRKSTVVLKIPFDTFSKTNLIEKLTKHNLSGTADEVYQTLRDVLKAVKGHNYVPDVGLMIHQLLYISNTFNVPLSHKKRINDFIRDAIKSDPAISFLYSSEQQFGTCGDSNLTPIDKMLAPETTNLVVFQHTVASLIDEVREKFLSSKPKMKTQNVQEAILQLETVLKKKQLTNHLACLNKIKDLVEQRNQEMEKQKKLPIISRENLTKIEEFCMETIKELKINSPESFLPMIDELVYHLIKSWDHAKPIQMLATKKLIEVQKKLEFSATTTTIPFSRETIQKMIEETILTDCSEVDESLPIDQYVKPFIAKLAGLEAPLKEKYNSQLEITYNAIKNTCPIDIERIRKKLNSKQNQEIDQLLAEYQEKYEFFKGSLEKEIPALDKKTYLEKIQKFNEDFQQQDFTIEQPMAFIAIWRFSQIMSKIK